MNLKMTIEAEKPRFEEVLIRRISLWVVAVLIALCGTVGLMAAETNAVPDVPGGSVVNVSESPLTEKAEEFREKGYMVEGEMVEHHYELKDQRYKFEYIQKGSKWKLRIGKPEYYVFPYREEGYDGTNLYVMMYMNKLPLEEMRKKSERHMYIQAKILPEYNYPMENLSPRIVWESCASITPEIIENIGGCRFGPRILLDEVLEENVECEGEKANNYIMEYKLYPDTGLLQSARIYEPDELGGLKEKRWGLEIILERDNNNESMPIKSFKYKYINPFIENLPYVLWSYHGRITNVDKAPKEFDPKPEILEKHYVTDYRAREELNDYIEYNIMDVKNTNWLSTNSLRYKTILAEAIQKKEAEARRALMIYIFIVTVVIGAVALIWIYKPWRIYKRL